MAEIGDIVRVETGLRYVIAAFLGGPNGPLARLVRRKSNGTTVSFVRAEADLIVAESPHFTIGESVRVRGERGVVVGGQTERGPVLVRFPAMVKALTSAPDIKIQSEPDVAAVPIWLLVLENKI